MDIPLHTLGLVADFPGDSNRLVPFPGFYPGMDLDLVRVTGELSHVNRHKFWSGDVGEEKGRRVVLWVWDC